jgi:hypothetical protein
MELFCVHSQLILQYGGVDARPAIISRKDDSSCEVDNLLQHIARGKWHAVAVFVIEILIRRWLC